MANFDKTYTSRYAQNYKLNVFDDDAVDVSFRIAVDGERKGSLCLNPSDAVDLATSILAHYAPEKLAELPRKPLAEQVGEFFKAALGDRVVQIVGPDLDSGENDDHDRAVAVTESGARLQIYNEPEMVWWEHVPADKVTIKTTWEV